MFGTHYGFGFGRLGSSWCGFAGADWWTRGLMIGLVVVGITIVVLLAVHLAKRSHTSQGNSEALAILNNRYANGEIDEETYRNMKRTLR